MQRAQPEEWTSREVARLLALVESERRYYQEIVAAVPVGLLVVSSDLIIVSSNRAARRILNPENGNAVRGHLGTLFPGAIPDKIQEVFKSREPLCGLKIESQGRHLRIGAMLIRNGEEERDSDALVTVEDITVPSSDSMPEIARQQSPFTAPVRTESIELLKNLDAILWALDISSKQFLLVTSTAGEVLGFPPDHWIKTPGFWAERIDPADREEVLRSYQEAVEAGDRHSCEFRSRTADGRSVWLRETARVQKGPDGQPKHLIGLTLEVTERRALERQHVQAERVKAISALAGRLAHDLNNMLMVVNGYGEELVNRVQGDDGLRSDVLEILAATGRIGVLSDQLVAYTRRQPVPAEVLDVSELVHELEGVLKKSTSPPVDLRIQNEAGLLARAGRTQMQELLTNIAAHLAISRGTGILTITANESRITENLRGIDEVLPPGAYVVITVESKGVRMRQEAQIPLFESFLLVKDLTGESGAALSCAYTLVRDWGGDIFLEDSKEGSRISIYLPRADHKGSPAMQTPQSVNQATAVAATILLVEDEDGIRALVRKILSRQGYSVLEASDGAEAEMVFNEHKSAIDLLVTDVVLPKIGGGELAQRLRQQRGDLKVLYVSGYTEDSSIYSGDHRSGTSFLQKPFTLGKLLDKVKEMLRG